MSEWIEADTDSIQIDMDDKDVSVFVKQDDFGSIYLTLTFDQIKEIHDYIRDK